jgi:nitrogen fixation-related uncharacterized protein
MDAIAALVLFAIVTGLLGALGVASALWGVDSRPTIQDDHNR